MAIIKEFRDGVLGFQCREVHETVHGEQEKVGAQGRMSDKEQELILDITSEFIASGFNQGNRMVNYIKVEFSKVRKASNDE